MSSLVRRVPTPSEGMGSFGRISRIVAWVDANKGAFAVSRLILQTGIKLRDHHAATRDDPREVDKLMTAVTTMLTAEEQEKLRAAAGL